jgi:predicted helicase
VGLVSIRQYVYDSVKTYNYIFCTENIIDNRFFISNRGYCSVFPLYLYLHIETEKKSLLSHLDDKKKQPNIKPEIFKYLSGAYKKEVSPEEIFYYIYAVLYSETYRTKYAEFLKIDFPRVPFTKDYKLFKKMSDYGDRLADLHLLKSPELDSPIARFQGKGENRVRKLKYDDKAGVLYINKEQYFEGISQDVWSYQIGGYQVCDKWLKDRKDRVLSLDEIQTYCRIVTAIQKTINIQEGIDKIYDAVEQSL